MYTSLDTNAMISKMVLEDRQSTNRSSIPFFIRVELMPTFKTNRFNISKSNPMTCPFVCQLLAWLPLL